MNMAGEYDDVEYNGQELAFFVTDNDGVERVFMEGRLRAGNVTIDLAGRNTERRRKRRGMPEPAPKEESPIDFTLHELVDHFVIPDVPDVARINPVAYDRNIQLLEEIEAVTA
jgi:hypothetical protein